MDRARTAALLCLAAGILGAASGLALALVEPVGRHRPVQLPALRRRRSPPSRSGSACTTSACSPGCSPCAGPEPSHDTRPARWGWAAAVVGMAGLTVTELVGDRRGGRGLDSGIGGALGGLYGVTCTAMGVGLLMAGVSMWRAHTWEGWRRGVVLALGVWVFVPMFPALAVTPTDGARLAIGGWMLLFAALGVALLSPVRRAVPLPA